MAISFLNDVSLPGTSTSLLMADGSNIPVGADNSFLKVVSGEPVWTGSAPAPTTTPTLRSSGNVSIDGNNPINLPIPTHIAGDVIIVVCVVSYASMNFFNVTTPTGYTRLNASNNTNSLAYYNTAVYYKTAVSSEPNFQIEAIGATSDSQRTFQTATVAVFKDTTGITATNFQYTDQTDLVSSRIVPSITAPAANSLEVALVSSGGRSSAAVYNQDFTGTGWSLVEKNASQSTFFRNFASIYQVVGGSPAAPQNDITINTTVAVNGVPQAKSIGYTSLRLGAA